MTARFTDHILPPGLLADRPAANLVPEGALYPATDSNIIYQSDGAAWATWRGAAAGGIETIVAGTNITVDDTDPANPIVSASGGGGGGGGSERPLVDPTVQAFTWQNQGVASAVVRDATVTLVSPAENVDNWHLYGKAAPATPWSVIMHINPMCFDVAYQGVGVGWANAATGKFHILAQRNGGTMESLESTNGAYTGTSNLFGGQYIEHWRWIKVTNDGTNRKLYVSQDGYTWLLFHSLGSNNSFTPDRIVFGLEARSLYPVALVLDSWEEGA